MSAFRAVSLLRTSCRAPMKCALNAPLSRPRLATVTARQYSSGTTPPQADATSSSPADKGNGNGSGKWALAAVTVAAAGLAAYIYTEDVEAAKVKPVASKILSSVKQFKPTVADYQRVYNAIAADLEKDENYDDGSYGPVLVRLAWHASGTYDAKTGTGGSNGATMRFAPEAEHGANAGLVHARNYLDAIHKKYSWITYSDLWTLGGVVAVQELGGPRIPWRPGRTDREATHCTPDGRLPDGDKGASHLREMFYRMGFNDQEIVALAGAHALGRCHRDRSGYDGPWQHAPTSFTNAYYDLLLHEKWQWRKWDGPAQYTDKATGTLMMLPADMALIQDRAMRKYVEKYAASEEAFFSDFSKAFAKLLELGVPEDNFKQTALEGKPVILKTTAEQGL